MPARLVLVAACATAAVVAVVVGENPLKDWDSQLLWLSVNIVIISLAVEALLSRDPVRRRRRELY